jgi:hypothetical protein
VTVYVDDARIPATVGKYTDRWSHLMADDRDELHRFAQRIGLRRSWFQDPCAPNRKPWPAKPGSPAAENWHYDVTENMRERAIRQGAKPVTCETLLLIIRKRWEAANG